MDARIRTLWLDALASGEYEKGKHALRVGDNYCCLGVLCELARTEGVVERSGRLKGGQSGYRASGSKDKPDYMVLPDAVSKWAGLEDHNPASITIVNDLEVTFEPVIHELDIRVEEY